MHLCYRRCNFLFLEDELHVSTMRRSWFIIRSNSSRTTCTLPVLEIRASTAIPTNLRNWSCGRQAPMLAILDIRS